MFGLYIWRWERGSQPGSMLKATGVENSSPPFVIHIRPCAHTTLTTSSRLQIRAAGDQAFNA